MVDEPTEALFLDCKGPEGTPLWLKPEKFLQAKFNADDYVADLRRVVSTSYYLSCFVRIGVSLREHLDPSARHDHASSCLLLTNVVWQVPLESLSAELDSYLASLKKRVRFASVRKLQLPLSVPNLLVTVVVVVQLVEVINEDYDDFVSLSSKLVSVDGAVLRMQKPLLELKVTCATAQCARSLEY